MSPENKDILFEKRDTDTRTISILLIWMIVITLVVSLLMIPLTDYLWTITQQPHSSDLTKTPTPSVVLEVIPNQELHKMNLETAQAQDTKKIETAIKDMLEKGFPVKS